MSNVPIMADQDCFLQDGAAMSLDLLGTCYTDQLRPPPLKPHHIAIRNSSGTAANRPLDELPSAGMLPGGNQELIAAGEASGLVLSTSGVTAADATMQGESQAPSGQLVLQAF